MLLFYDFILLFSESNILKLYGICAPHFSYSTLANASEIIKEGNKTENDKTTEKNLLIYRIF